MDAAAAGKQIVAIAAIVADDAADRNKRLPTQRTKR
jgi:hypothetical protein